MKIKIALLGPGGELDSRTVNCEPDDDDAISRAVEDVTLGHCWHSGDRLVIAEDGDSRAFE